MLQDYTAPAKNAILIFEKNKPVIFTLLAKPVFAWHDIAFEKDENTGKSTKVYEEYRPYKNGQKAPQIVGRPDILGYADKPRKFKHKWLCEIYNHDVNQVQLAELEHYTLHNALYQIDAEYELLETPIKIIKSGEKTETNYTATPLQARNYPLPADIQERRELANIDLESVFTTFEKEVADLEVYDSQDIYED
jgi:hypothetical protein